MPNESPAVILYDENGLPVAVQHGGTLSPLHSGIPIGGRDDQDPTGGTGRIVSVSYDGALIAMAPKRARTAFDEIRVASPFSLVDLVNKYEIDPRRYSQSTATGGSLSHLPNESAVRLTVTSSNGSQAKLRTNDFCRYQAGHGLMFRTSIYHADAGQSNQVRRWGFFDDGDGLFFELSGTALRVVRRTSVTGSAVDTAAAQSSWNVDKLDGTGRSGVTLDVTKANIYEVQLQWLGAGQVRFYINGILVHEMSNQNVFSAPYMKTAQLPLSWEVVNTGASVGSSMTYVCASVVIEGGEDPPAYSFAAYNATDVNVTTTERPVLSIRPKATFNSITNRMILMPVLLGVSTEGSRIGFRLVWSSSLSGASYSSVDSKSGAEFDVSATSGTGGETLFRGFIGGSNDATVVDISKLFKYRTGGRKLRLDAFGSNPDVLTVYAVNEGVGSSSVRASLSWEEIR